MPLSRRIFTVAVLAGAVSAIFLLAPAPDAPACGGYFSRPYLESGAQALPVTPESYFENEIRKLTAPKSNEAMPAPLTLPVPSDDDAKGPDKEAEEFALYEKGAVAYRHGKLAEARKHWGAVLALPAAQRRQRSVRAAYMIGRSLVPDAEASGMPQRTIATDAEAQKLYGAARVLRRVRKLVEAGYPDPQDLATASLGWEARAYFLHGHEDVRAIRLYLLQYAAGETLSAQVSLRAVARAATRNLIYDDPAVGGTEENRREERRVLQHFGANAATKDAVEGQLLRLADNDDSRHLITAYLLDRYREYAHYYSDDGGITLQSRNWAAILQKAHKRDIDAAGEFAWLAYQGGGYALAKAWAELASDDSLAANWVHAKLALRAGDLKSSEMFLERVVASKELSSSDTCKVWQDLGRVRMARGKYAAALDASRVVRDGESIAYIAERVFTLEELQAYVDAKCPAPLDGDEYQRNGVLRRILAQRLARANEHVAALRYFDTAAGERCFDYLTAVRGAFDAERAAADRAASFWKAALLTHEYGGVILGGSAESWRGMWDGGRNDSTDVLETRRTWHLKEWRQHWIPAPTPDELSRVEKSAFQGNHKYFQYRAADLAWWAAALMPNDSEETARVLDEAGGWLKYLDPQAANRFFQALVIRCGNTKIGKAAAVKNWFSDEKTSVADVIEATEKEEKKSTEF